MGPSLGRNATRFPHFEQVKSVSCAQWQRYGTQTPMMPQNKQQRTPYSLWVLRISDMLSGVPRKLLECSLTA